MARRRYETVTIVSTYESSSDLSSAPSVEGQAVTFAVERHGARVILSVSGEIDMVTAPGLQEELVRLLSEPVEILVVDLSKVDFFASAGLSALVVGYQLAEQQQAKLRVVATNSATIRPLQITALDRRIPICDTREQALKPEF